MSVIKAIFGEELFFFNLYELCSLQECTDIYNIHSCLMPKGVKRKRIPIIIPEPSSQNPPQGTVSGTTAIPVSKRCIVCSDVFSIGAEQYSYCQLCRMQANKRTRINQAKIAELVKDDETLCNNCGKSKGVHIKFKRCEPCRIIQQQYRVRCKARKESVVQEDDEKQSETTVEAWKLNRFQVMVSNARIRANERGQKEGREEAGIFNLNKEDLVHLDTEQKGLCYYSGEPYTWDRGDWNISLERPKPGLGYTPSTVKFSCEEFNGQIQWSFSKSHEVIQALNMTKEERLLKWNALHKRLNEPTVITSTRYPTIASPDPMHKTCPTCMRHQTLEEFYRGDQKKKFSICYACQLLQNYMRNYNLRYFFQLILKGARRHTRKMNKARGLNMAMSLELEDLYDMAIQCQGECAISGIPLNFFPSNSFQCSLERLDNDGPYSRENVVFICLEFNTNKQWTKQKFDYILPKLQARLQQPEVIALREKEMVDAWNERHLYDDDRVEYVEDEVNSVNAVEEDDVCSNDDGTDQIMVPVETKDRWTVKIKTGNIIKFKRLS